MYGSKITGNTSPNIGVGNVYITFGTFTMHGGEISGNTAKDGGGVYNASGAFFTMHGGEISGNTALGSGGGVQQFGTFTMSGGVIYGSGAAASLKNTASLCAAIWKGISTPQYGRLIGGVFTPTGDLDTTDDTVRVVDGVLYNN